MFDDCMAIAKMNNDKSKEDYAICNSEADQKCFMGWSPLERNAYSLKHRYVSCSRSVPHRSKRFVRYRISRSLNFDASVRSSSSENSTIDEDKHLSRSAKIMRALNFNSSPPTYGKTKIKRSLNFNATPSPKRFTPVRRNIRKSLSMNFNSPLSVSTKFLNYEDNPGDSVNSSLLFSSSESIDENQNETPSQRGAKERGIIHYSTPNAKLTSKPLCSANFTPLLRSRLKETIDNIVYITATPHSQSLKRVKGRSKCISNVSMNTSRNLLHEFHDQDDERPCTPENIVHIIPESMSAIKRSHKKERSSKRSDRCAMQLTTGLENDENDIGSFLTRHSKHLDSLQKCKPIADGGDAEKNSDASDSIRFEDDMSDTGSIFDYREERERVAEDCSKLSDSVSNGASCSAAKVVDAQRVEAKLDENIECFTETSNVEEEFLRDLSTEAINLPSDARPGTPEPAAEVAMGSEKSVTPENRINILQRVANDSIKKSHKKVKDDNKRRLFSPKVLQSKLEAAAEPDVVGKLDTLEQRERSEAGEISMEQILDDASGEDRSCTPEKVTSSRLLLSQFSSVKKSHKKDKHNKILHGFLKRQEYFNKDMDLVANSKSKSFDVDDASECKAEHFSSNSDLGKSVAESACLDPDSFLDKLSPSKRKKLPDTSMDGETSASFESELQESDTSKEEFKIFTPLKRKRSLTALNNVRGYLHYDLPCDKNELLEDINFSRCLTPVPNLPNNCANARENDAESDCNVSSESEEEAQNCESNDATTGRSTPRNMSTTELLVNLDSIKKSHKKNKRGNGLRNGVNLAVKRSAEGKGDSSIESSTMEDGTRNALEISSDCVVSVDKAMNESIKVESVGRVHVEEDASNLDSSGNFDEARASSSEGNALSSVTPPNCVRTKSYMKLLQETSIKRSHKTVRAKRKQELTVEADELSDDGSIFGDEEKLAFAKD